MRIFSLNESQLNIKTVKTCVKLKYAEYKASATEAP